MKLPTPKQVAKETYAWWRFVMWMRGYGTGDKIDEAVEQGHLIPFRQYPVRLSDSEAEDETTNP